MARSDFNKDGYSDILWSKFVYGTTIFGEGKSSWNMGPGGKMNGHLTWPEWSASWYGDNGYGKTSPWAQGDYNGDGYADILTARPLFPQDNYNEWGWWETKPGTSSIEGKYTPSTEYHSLGTWSADWWVRGGDQTDFTGDGTDDILMYNNVTHEIGYYEMKNEQIVRYQELTGFKWLMDSGWAPAADRPDPTGDGRGGFGGDFNGDGRDDILLTKWTGEAGIAFASATSTSGLKGLGYIGRIEETGDFTGDGSTDIISNQNGNLYLYDMLNGAVSNTRYLGNFPGWDIAGGAAGDFTGDGVEDVVWRHNSTGEVGYWDFNHGDGSWINWVSLGTVGLDWITV